MHIKKLALKKKKKGLYIQNHGSTNATNQGLQLKTGRNQNMTPTITGTSVEKEWKLPRGKPLCKYR